MVEIKGTMDELKEIFIGAAIFGAKQEVKRQGTKLGKKATQAVVEGTAEGIRRANRKVTRMDREMKKALKEANAKYRNKNGSLKKGKTQSDIMKLAHRIRRRVMK